MQKLYILILVLGVLPALSYLYFVTTFSVSVDKVFLSISTFLFSIFTGFFISRQASRFNRVRETVTKFDGLMSSLYRQSGHISAELQEEFAKIIKLHYKKILKQEAWDYHFMHKSTTLQSLHAGLDNYVEEENITKLSNQALGAIVKGLGAAQGVRKQMVALRQEVIPVEQWILILFFAVMLIGTASTVPSAALFFPSILKAAFVVSVLSVLFILYRLNSLSFTEKVMGEESAQDVLGIIAGKK